MRNKIPIWIKIFQSGGSFPIGNKSLYDHVTAIYLSLVDKGVHPQAALDLVNLKVAEQGWKGWVTGDGKRYKNVDEFTNHLIDWHGRMYPKSLNATDFNSFYIGINGTKEQHDRFRNSGYKLNSGRSYYNSKKPYNTYKKELLNTRPGVKKRINHYRLLLGLGPLAYVEVPSDYNIT